MYFLKKDVLLNVSINGEKLEITRQYHIIDMMLDIREGDVLIFEILRDGEKMNVTISITEECLGEY